MKQVILFKGSDCVPCTQFEPVFDKVMENSLVSIRKEVDNIDLMRSYGLRSVPVVVFLEEGDEVGILMGKDLNSRNLAMSLLDFETN